MKKESVYVGTTILGLSMVLAACNNGGTGNTGGNETVVCTIKTTGSNTYSPDTCNVKVGQKVSIESSNTHPLLGVVAGGPISTDFANPVLPTAPDTSVTVTFTSAGIFGFFCKNHGTATAGMKGTITVTN